MNLQSKLAGLEKKLLNNSSHNKPSVKDSVLAKIDKLD